MMVNVSQ
jgi:hypothetical protein